MFGRVSAQEKREVESMAHIYPDIAEELRLLQSKVEMPMSENPTSASSSSSDEEEDLPVEDPAQPANRTYSVALTASIILLLGMAGMYWSKNAEVSSLSAQVVQLGIEKDSLSRQLAELGEKQQRAGYAASLLKDPAVKTIYLKGVAHTSPGSKAVVCWHSTHKTVHLAVDSLPPLANGKQYQLWAIVEGHASDMGVLPIEVLHKDFQAMPVMVNNPEAFVITLEKEGGSTIPSSDQMYAIGSF